MFHVLDDCSLGCHQMDEAIGTFLDDRYMHRCMALFDGERWGIKGPEVGNVVKQINAESGGLNEREANNGVHSYVRARCNDNASRQSVPHEAWKVESQTHRELRSDGFTTLLDNTQ